jgi:hypothetical protein
LTAWTRGLAWRERHDDTVSRAFKGKERTHMDRTSGDRSRSKNVTSGTPGRGRSNPYTNSKMPLEHEETREREDLEDLEEE